MQLENRTNAGDPGTCCEWGREIKPGGEDKPVPGDLHRREYLTKLHREVDPGWGKRYQILTPRFLSIRNFLSGVGKGPLY